MTQAWFSALGEPLADDERREIADYLAGLGMDAALPVFLRKYALYCGGRWPLGLYHGRFSIF